jgi:hypothetical protein
MDILKEAQSISDMVDATTALVSAIKATQAARESVEAYYKHLRNAGLSNQEIVVITKRLEKELIGGQNNGA